MVDPIDAIVLLIAGGAMGFVNNLAGAGGVIGLAAFDLVAGLSPVGANATLRPAALAIGLAGMAGFRSKGHRIPGRAWGLGAATLPGAIAGAILAVRLPPIVYQLTLAIVVSVLLYQQLRRGKKSASPLDSAKRETKPWIAFAVFSVVGLHMGFLQVGVGLTTMAALSYIHSKDLIEINATKMAVVTTSATASIIAFAQTGTVAWGPALWLAAGAGLGSFCAGRWSVRRGHSVIRGAVISICSLVLVRLVWQALT